MTTTPGVNGQEVLDRLTRLQAVTASLSEAVTAAQVADALLTQALASLGAVSGVVYQLTADRSEFIALRMQGYAEEVASNWGRFSADASTPVADAARLGKPVVVSSVAQMRERYPLAARFPTLQGEAAAVALPLMVRGAAIGAIGLRFPREVACADTDLSFLMTLAGLCAQALDRAHLFDA